MLRIGSRFSIPLFFIHIEIRFSEKNKHQFPSSFCYKSRTTQEISPLSRQFFDRILISCRLKQIRDHFGESSAITAIYYGICTPFWTDLRQIMLDLQKRHRLYWFESGMRFIVIFLNNKIYIILQARKEANSYLFGPGVTKIELGLARLKGVAIEPVFDLGGPWFAWLEEEVKKVEF